jgi:hypothetical protein
VERSVEIFDHQTGGHQRRRQVRADGRNDDGLEIWEFNTTLGQWRPAVDSKGVTNCKNVRDVVECDGVGPGNGIVGGPVNFTALSTPPTAGSPCSPNPMTGFNTCHYTSLPTQLANAVWGPVSSQCAYQSGRANTGWTFGCSLGGRFLAVVAN